MRFVFEIIDNFEDLIREMKTVMFNLDFTNNFKSFITEEIELKDNEITAISNQMFPIIPSSFIVVDQQPSSMSVTGNIVRPDTDASNIQVGKSGPEYRWNEKTLFLRSTNGTTKARILFIVDGTEKIPDTKKKK